MPDAVPAKRQIFCKKEKGASGKAQKKAGRNNKPKKHTKQQQPSPGIGRKLIRFADTLIDKSVFLVCLILFLMGFYGLYDSYMVYQSTMDNSLLKYKPGYESDDSSPEKEIEGNMVAWLTLDDTKVDYPVMQHEGDNEYYIHRNFEEEWDGSGLPFMDLRSNYMLPTDNLLIYGHNMKTGTMFAGILKYDSEEYYQTHKTLTFDTLDADGEYEVIAAFYSQIYPEEDTEHFKYYEFFDAGSEEEFNAYVEQVQALTPYKIDTEVSYGDTLLTLSTCAYNTENGRFVLVAKQILTD